jgi:hypothetical protein
MEILNELAAALDNASIPQDSISPILSSWAFPSTKVTDEKVSFITILDPSLATRIVTIISMTFDLSLPTITDALPHYPTKSDVDTSSEPSHNCRIKTCPFYNGGMNIFSDNPQGLLNAQTMASTSTMIPSFPYQTIYSKTLARQDAAPHAPTSTYHPTV